MKASSYHPVRGKRQARTPTGMDPVGRGTVPAVPERGPAYPKSLGSMQPRDRSLGMKRVRTRTQEKGV